jgi:hypothetical protein
MAPKKGLSFDEKRDRLLELFTESVCLVRSFSNLPRVRRQ